MIYQKSQKNNEQFRIMNKRHTKAVREQLNIKIFNNNSNNNNLKDELPIMDSLLMSPSKKPLLSLRGLLQGSATHSPDKSPKQDKASMIHTEDQFIQVITQINKSEMIN